MRAVLAFVSAAEEIGWDLSQGHLFPTVTGDGTHGELPPTAAQMPEWLQQHLRVTGMPPQYIMHSFRVGGSLTQSLEGTAVDAIMRMAR